MSTQTQRAATEFDLTEEFRKCVPIGRPRDGIEKLAGGLARDEGFRGVLEERAKRMQIDL
jgi:hypothetical protein